MINLNKYSEIDISHMNRDEAVLIYNNRVYIDSNHQYALETALNEENKSMGIDLDDDIFSAAEVTYNMSRENEICTLDIYVDRDNTGYLISHFEEQIPLNWELINQVLSNNNLILGTFPDGPGSRICKIFVEQSI